MRTSQILLTLNVVFVRISSKRERIYAVKPNMPISNQNVRFCRLRQTKPLAQMARSIQHQFFLLFFVEVSDYDISDSDTDREESKVQHEQRVNTTTSDKRPMFTNQTRAIVYGMQPRAVQV